MLTRRTVVFFAFAAMALSAAAYFSMTRTVGADVGPRKLLSARQGRTVRRVSFEFNGGVAEVEYVGGAWKFVSGDRGGVDSSRMGEILEAVTGAAVRDRITERQRTDRRLTLDMYGLDPALSVVKITDSAGETTVNFGTNSVGAFASVDGRSDVFMVDRSVFELLPKSESDLLDRMPFDLDGRAVEKLEIRRTGEPVIRIACVESGAGWNMSSPVECAADPVCVENVLNAVVISVVEKHVSEPRLSSEETSLSLSLWYRGDPAPRVFAFGYPQTKGGAAPVRVSALTDGGEYLVQYNVFTALSMPADTFRDHRLFLSDPGDVTSLSARFDDCSFKLVRSENDGAWNFEQPSGNPADASRVNEFLVSMCALCDTNAVAVDADSGRPSGGVEITLGSSSRSETVAFADGVAFSKSLRREMAAESLPDVSRRTFIRLCSPLLFGGNPDFTAESVESLSPADSSAYGLLPPAAEFSLNSGDTNRPVAVVQLGSEGPDGSRFLRVKGRDAVFTVSSNTVAELLLKSKENKNEIQSQGHEGR